MSVRILAALGLTLAAMAGEAQAASIVVLGVSTSTPSIIKAGEPEPAEIASTRSIVAFGEAQPAVTYEKVAAIPEAPRHGQAPTIIRGGVVGGAFATPAPTKASTAAAPAADTKPAEGTSPAAGTKPAAETAPAGTATASNGKPQPEPAAAPKPVQAASELK
jgi:hypothetical protein